MEIVQYVAEVKKPDGERLPQFHEAGLDSLRYRAAVSREDLSIDGKALHEDGPEPGKGKTRRR
jgi:hypothetical protein